LVKGLGIPPSQMMKFLASAYCALVSSKNFQHDVLSLLQVHAIKTNRKNLPLDLLMNRNDWGYSDTDAWVNQYPECGGSAQSPIDIPASGISINKTKLNASYDNTVGVNETISLMNNGHTLQVNGNFGALHLPDGTYDAQQLHFHFASEHTVKGKQFAGEMQIVHQKRGATGMNDLAVLAVLLEPFTEGGSGGALPTAESADFFALIGMADSQHLPEEGHAAERPLGTAVKLGPVLRPQLEGKFYHYKGSLTTPPCSETVHWFVFDHPMFISSDIIWDFKVLFPSPANHRPVQPLNDRPIAQGLEEIPNEFPVHMADDDDKPVQQNAAMQGTPRPDVAQEDAAEKEAAEAGEGTIDMTPENALDDEGFEEYKVASAAAANAAAAAAAAEEAAHEEASSSSGSKDEDQEMSQARKAAEGRASAKAISGDEEGAEAEIAEMEARERARPQRRQRR